MENSILSTQDADHTKLMHHILLVRGVSHASMHVAKLKTRGVIFIAEEKIEEVYDMSNKIKLESWNIIGELTDKNVLGLDGMSKKEPRRTARAIMINEEGLYAVLYAKKFNLYSLPGGGIEDGEDEVSTLIREMDEETGCTCDTIEQLGVVSENRGHQDYTTLSYYFVVHTKTKKYELHLTELEEENGTILKWCSLEELIHLIRDVEHETNQRKFLQARDMVALTEYRKWLQ